jgi:hypothetical protein
VLSSPSYSTVMSNISISLTSNKGDGLDRGRLDTAPHFHCYTFGSAANASWQEHTTSRRHACNVFWPKRVIAFEE